ncbi:hypothetical protein P175DRAFT_0536165 [Aspergillus ochraceoroseus IBT 24754]|uniref:Uncharacterized protein n=1 Tax=Aspergillus ochraceoroseus IBT 24754 TaxID=1392256 RepID=A0A2T5LM39_9EURO|nr:uncharacterized protein P175DRAFT_0536165 [Aspergillus ochraceoroseus IBT 24754]PTU17343.1 hypothetical protein P175DRAFT_0536165 [Aspergillus ochraceoroseus IBT 24754]
MYFLNNDSEAIKSEQRANPKTEKKGWTPAGGFHLSIETSPFERYNLLLALLSPPASPFLPPFTPSPHQADHDVLTFVVYLPECSPEPQFGSHFHLVWLFALVDGSGADDNSPEFDIATASPASPICLRRVKGEPLLTFVTTSFPGLSPSVGIQSACLRKQYV